MIVADFPVRGDEKDIFRLQISVSQFAVVQKSNWVTQLKLDKIWQYFKATLVIL